MRRRRPAPYFIEYLPLAKAARPDFDIYGVEDYDYDDAATLSTARLLGGERLAEGLVGQRCTIYRRGGFRYRSEDDSWDYNSMEIEVLR